MKASMPSYSFDGFTTARFKDPNIAHEVLPKAVNSIQAAILQVVGSRLPISFTTNYLNEGEYEICLLLRDIPAHNLSGVCLLIWGVLDALELDPFTRWTQFRIIVPE